MSLTVRPYQPGDLQRIDMVNAGHLIGIMKIAEEHALRGWAFTGVDGDRVVAAGGITSYWPHVGEGWASLSFDAIRSPLAACRQFRMGLDTVIAEQRMRRVQAHVNLAFAAGHRFATFLGFKPESLMRAFGPNGEDFICYVRFA